MEKQTFRWITFFLFIFLICFAWFKLFLSSSENILYSEFKTLLKANLIKEVHLGGSYISATLKPDSLNAIFPLDKIEKIKQAGNDELRVSAVRAPDPTIIQELEAAKVPFTGRIDSLWQSALITALPLLLFIFLFWQLLLKGGRPASGVAEMGKNKAIVYVEKETKVTFADVAGVDEAKAELIEIVNFLKNPQHFYRLGAKLPKGVLLVGPPGTGKTLLARALAGESGVPFFSINGSEFVELYVGVGAARVRDLFRQARLNAPAILFIDELDAVGRARNSSFLSGGHDEKEQTLNQLLSEMDGFDSSAGLVVVAATNRPEILDQALLRAGRFDRHVLVDKPDKLGRKQILSVHMKKIHCDAQIDHEQIAALTPGFTGADLANLVNEAALSATRHEAKLVTFENFTEAFERIIAGLEKKNRLLNKKEREIIAYHEVGHALVSLLILDSNSIQKISIIPRGIKSLGFTMQRPTEERYLMTQDELQMKMAVLLGGRAAEQIIFEDLSTGAADDLIKATEIARSMVMRYGMCESLGNVSYESEGSPFLPGNQDGNQPRNFSEKTAQEIDEAISQIIKKAYNLALNTIKSHKQQLEEGAQLLLLKETLNEKEILALIRPTTTKLENKEPEKLV